MINNGTLSTFDYAVIGTANWEKVRLRAHSQMQLDAMIRLMSDFPTSHANQSCTCKQGTPYSKIANLYLILRGFVCSLYSFCFFLKWWAERRQVKSVALNRVLGQETLSPVAADATALSVRWLMNK